MAKEHQAIIRTVIVPGWDAFPQVDRKHNILSGVLTNSRPARHLISVGDEHQVLSDKDTQEGFKDSALVAPATHSLKVFLKGSKESPRVLDHLHSTLFM